MHLTHYLWIPLLLMSFVDAKKRGSTESDIFEQTEIPDAENKTERNGKSKKLDQYTYI